MTRAWPCKPVGTFVRIFAITGALMLAFAATQARATETYAHWSLESRTAPASLHVGEEGMVVVTATNLGDADVNGAAPNTVTLTDALPTDVEAIGTEASSNHVGVTTIVNERKKFGCPQPTGGRIECTYSGKLPPYEILQLKIRVMVKSGAATAENDVTVNGGDTHPASESLERPIKIGGETAFGVEGFEMTPETESFEKDTQAGSHPYQLTTTFNLNQEYELYEHPSVAKYPSAPALEDDLSFRLPPGLIGNVNAVKQCNAAEFGSDGGDFTNACPNETAIGVASVTVFDPDAESELYATYVVPVFNLEPAPGEPARFGFSILHVPVVLETSVRTGEDYGVTVSVHYASQTVQVLGSKVTFWGMPADESHNQSRGWACLFDIPEPELGKVEECGQPTKPSRPVEPYLMLPTSGCHHEPTPLLETALQATVSGDAWNGARLTGPGEKLGPRETEEVPAEHPLELTGCSGLEFNPSIDVETESHEASTPTGLAVTVNVPQAGTMEASYHSRAEAAVHSTKLELPPEMQASAGAANGLETCSIGAAGFLGAVGSVSGLALHSPDELEAQTGAALGEELGTQGFTPAAPACPEAAKIGSVNIKTPLLERELTGAVYLAQQDTDPFASPLALYLIAEDKGPQEKPGQSKVLVKLAGEVTINPSTGQLVSDFKNTPETPFETLTLHLWSGARASQATPSRCGPATAHSEFQTSSEGIAPVTPESTFQITSGAGGGPCPGATLPFQPSFGTEATNTNAGAYTAFKLRIGVPDGDAALKTIDMQLPPGLAAVLQSVTLCPEPQASQGTCSPDSAIGEAVALSGLGATPVRLPGTVYLTGPYNGAPFGLSSVTEANAGPFHLGTVVVRSGIYVNPYTAAATINTEAAKFIPLAPVAGEQTEFAGLPERLKGVPSQVKALEVTVNRPNFEFNPTNCEGMSVTGALTGYEGTSEGVSSPFQVGNCGALPFAPKLTATVSGHGSKVGGVTFDVKVESAGIGQANIHKVDLTLPEVLPSRQSTIEKACLESVFNANPANCDEGSLIGEGIVQTPVFKNPLRGPAYLVSHGAAAFPDVEFVLQGEGVTVILDGKTDIKKGITYSKFETSPDAPFTSFESNFPAGPHSALTTYVPEKEDFSLCKSASKLVMPTEITGQNNAFISQTTKIELVGCGEVKSSKVKKLTRKQKLAKALKACRHKYKKKKAKRIACEKQARKKYGPKKKPKKPAHKGAKKSSAAKR